VWFDSEVGQLEFVHTQPRPVIDLPIIEASDLTAAQLGEKLVVNARWSTRELPIVRQRVLNVHQETRREMSMSLIREIDARTLFYRLDMLAPASVTSGLVAPGQVATLESCWETHIDATPLAAGIDKSRLKQLGLDLLQEVSEHEAAPVEA
jgi:hypothetical protein